MLRGLDVFAGLFDSAEAGFAYERGNVRSVQWTVTEFVQEITNFLVGLNLSGSIE